MLLELFLKRASWLRSQKAAIHYRYVIGLQFKRSDINNSLIQVAQLSQRPVMQGGSVLSKSKRYSAHIIGLSSTNAM